MGNSIIHCAHYDLGENNVLHASTTVPVRKKSLSLENQRLKHLRKNNESMATPSKVIHHCAFPQDRTREFVEYDSKKVIQILQDHNISTLFYIGGGTLFCVMFRPIGYHNMFQKGFTGIIVSDLTYDATFCFDNEQVDMIKAGVYTFERVGGASVTSKSLVSGLSS